MRTPLPERRLVGAANIPCSVIYMIYTPQQIGCGLALYIYACLIHRMDSPVMGGTGEPYFTCNVLIPHPMIHYYSIVNFALSWSACVHQLRGTRYEIRGARYRVRRMGHMHGARGTWYEARGMWHAV